MLYLKIQNTFFCSTGLWTTDLQVSNYESLKKETDLKITVDKDVQDRTHVMALLIMKSLKMLCDRKHRSANIKIIQSSQFHAL